jgi:hypothetical protein
MPAVKFISPLRLIQLEENSYRSCCMQCLKHSLEDYYLYESTVNKILLSNILYALFENNILDPILDNFNPVHSLNHVL